MDRRAMGASRHWVLPMRASDQKPDPHGECQCEQCKDMLDYVLRAQKAALEEEAKQWLNEIAFPMTIITRRMPRFVAKGDVYQWKNVRYEYDGQVWKIIK